MTSLAAPAAALAPRIPRTLRAAQLLLAVPLGIFQLAASVVFTVTLGVDTPWQVGVVAWAWTMSAACAVVAFRLARDGRARRAAFALLALQLGFSFVKLTVYHESASFVFAGVALAAAALLALRRAALPL
jgi:hypothetical protein